MQRNAKPRNTPTHTHKCTHIHCLQRYYIPSSGGSIHFFDCLPCQSSFCRCGTELFRCCHGLLDQFGRIRTNFGIQGHDRTMTICNRNNHSKGSDGKRSTNHKTDKNRKLHGLVWFGLMDLKDESAKQHWDLNFVRAQLTVKCFLRSAR